MEYGTRNHYEIQIQLMLIEEPFSITGLYWEVKLFAPYYKDCVTCEEPSQLSQLFARDFKIVYLRSCRIGGMVFSFVT